jgi:hypothetical protein
MPLARIITKSADDSLELSMQLRSRGFRVETVAPGQIPNAPADLEVCLEECAPEDVLTNAAIVQQSEDLWVFVAPGALDERSRPMRVIPHTPQVVEIRTPEHAAAVAALKPSVEAAAVELKIPEVIQTAPVVEVQVPAVVVKEVVFTPEDDPLLCELEPPVAVAIPTTSLSKVEEISIPLAIADTPIVAPPESKPAEVVPLPFEVKVRETVPPVEVKAPAQVESKSQTVPAHTLEHVKKLAVVQHVAQIPIVPERVEPKIVLYRPAPPKPKRLGPWRTYKVAFQTGPRLWRTASVTVALVVLAALVATVVSVRPPLPKKGTASTPSPAIFLPTAQAANAATIGTAASRPVAPKADVPRPTPTHRLSASDDGRIAEDTVVFYNHKPAPPREATLPKPAPSGAKRYSDTE